MTRLPSEPVHKFTQELKDSQGEEKGTVTLQCETAQPATKVTWSKGSTELRTGGRYEITQKEGVCSLTIRQLEEADSGTYSCDVGTAKSAAKLTVKGKNKGIFSTVGSTHDRSVFHMLNTDLLFFAGMRTVSAYVVLDIQSLNHVVISMI